MTRASWRCDIVPSLTFCEVDFGVHSHDDRAYTPAARSSLANAYVLDGSSVSVMRDWNSKLPVS